MGIKTRIEDLVIDLSTKKPIVKIGARLIEAGLKCLDQVDALQPNLRISPDFDERGDFTGTYHLTLFQPRIIEESPNLLDDLPVFALESAQEAALQPDSTLQATGTALKLLVLLYGLESSDTVVRGIQVHVDDQPILSTLVELGFVTRDEVKDFVLVTTKGREAIGVRPAGLPSLPVEVAELTGNVPEAELAARYVDGKVLGCERHIREGSLPGNEDALRYLAAVLGEIAHEFRAGLHLPSVTIEGRIIPYNEERSGLVHADSLQTFFDDVYARNLKAGWWTNIETGEPKKRNVGELFILMVTELAEAYKAYVLNENDDKLPQYPGVGVEMGDLIIRVADFCGAVAAGNIIEFSAGSHNPGADMFAEVCEIAERYEAIRKTPAAKGDTECGDFIPAMLVGPMIDDKLAFNAKREDHKIENRLKEGGKVT